MEREPWDTDKHRERYRKVLNREMTLQAALYEATEEWKAQMDAIEAIPNLSALERQQARFGAVLRASS